MKTAMQELLHQLKDERTNSTMPSDWNRCYQAIEILISHTYIPMEKLQLSNAYCEGCNDTILDESRDAIRAEEYYNETYRGNK